MCIEGKGCVYSCGTIKNESYKGITIERLYQSAIFICKQVLFCIENYAESNSNAYECVTEMPALPDPLTYYLWPPMPVNCKQHPRYLIFPLLSWIYHFSLCTGLMLRQ